MPAGEPPPTHYRLLGIDEFQDDPAVIRAAAVRRMDKVQAFDSEAKAFEAEVHADISQKILDELDAANACLSDPAKKAEYDEQLRKGLASPEIDALGFLPGELVGPSETGLDPAELIAPAAESSAVAHSLLLRRLFLRHHHHLRPRLFSRRFPRRRLLRRELSLPNSCPTPAWRQ